MALANRMLEFGSLGLSAVNVVIVILCLALPTWIRNGFYSSGLWTQCIDGNCKTREFVTQCLIIIATEMVPYNN